MRVEGHRDEHLSFIMPILIGFVGHRRTYSREKREAEFIIVKKLLFFFKFTVLTFILVVMKLTNTDTQILRHMFTNFETKYCYAVFK